MTVIKAIFTAALFAATAANAASISYQSQTVTGSLASNLNGALVLPRFAPTLGTLTGADITFVGGTAGMVAYENLANVAPYFDTLDAGGLFFMNTEAGDHIEFNAYTGLAVGTRTTFDGIYDFGGSSGIAGMTSSYGFRTISVSNLADYIGTTDFTSNATAAGFYQGTHLFTVGPNAYATFRNENAAFYVAVTYTYDLPVVTPPVSGVPEPASWAMLIVGFGVVGAQARRRARHMPMAA